MNLRTLLKNAISHLKASAAADAVFFKRWKTQPAKPSQIVVRYLKERSSIDTE